MNWLNTRAIYATLIQNAINEDAYKVVNVHLGERPRKLKGPHLSVFLLAISFRQNCELRIENIGNDGVRRRLSDMLTSMVPSKKSGPRGTVRVKLSGKFEAHVAGP